MTNWTSCPACGSPAELLFIYPRCTRPGCRWYEERTQQVFDNECPTGIPWMTFKAPEEDGA